LTALAETPGLTAVAKQQSLSEQSVFHFEQQLLDAA